MKRIIIFASIIILLSLSFLFITNTDQVSAPPPTITNNFVDLEKIKEISKYRSCAGHVVVPTPSDERKRNMKHYFNIKDQYIDEADGIPIYAPFSGEIVSIHNIEGVPLDEEISFITEGSEWDVSILHIDVLDELREGDSVEGGEVIGHAKQSGFDVVYAVYADPGEQKVIEGWYDPYKRLDSIFSHMSERVFAQYLAAGVESKEQLILTKEQRDAKPCLYRDEAPALENPTFRDANWVKLD